MITKSKGIDCVLNLSSGESFYAAVQVIAKFGKMFNFATSDTKKQRYLGNFTIYFNC